MSLKYNMIVYSAMPYYGVALPELHRLEYCDIVFNGQLSAKTSEKDLLNGRSWRLKALHYDSPAELEACLLSQPLEALENDVLKLMISGDCGKRNC